MPYLTITDLETRDSHEALISLTDPNGVEVQASVIDGVIARAQAEVDSYIAGRVRLPLADGEVSNQIKHYALLIARWYLYAERKTDAVTAEYEAAMRWLRDVSAGRASTGVVQAPLDTDLATGTDVFAPVAKPLYGDDFAARYDVPMGPNGSGEWLR